MYHELCGVSCVLIILGALCALGGAAMNYYRMHSEVYSGCAEARVVDIITKRRTGASAMSEFRDRQTAVFEFYAGGKPFKVEDQSDAYPCPYVLNQRVRICYDPSNPQKYRLADSGRRKYLANWLQSSGVTAILAGAVLFLIYASRIEL